MNRVFYKAFIEYDSTIMFETCVINKSKNVDHASNQILFRMTGINGYSDSSDVTHITMFKLINWTNIGHKGFKLNLTRTKR